MLATICQRLSLIGMLLEYYYDVGSDCSSVLALLAHRHQRRQSDTDSWGQEETRRRNWGKIGANHDTWMGTGSVDVLGQGVGKLRSRGAFLGTNYIYNLGQKERSCLRKRISQSSWLD